MAGVEVKRGASLLVRINYGQGFQHPMPILVDYLGAKIHALVADKNIWSGYQDSGVPFMLAAKRAS